MKKIPLIIDTDPGIDDALGLLVISKHLDMFDLKLLTSTAGNVDIKKTTNNLSFFAKNFLNNAKVAKGSGEYLVRNKICAEDVHSANGLGNFKIGKQNYQIEQNAVESMYGVLNSSREKVTILSLGPMTNLAKLIINYPNVKNKIGVIYAMIGSIKGKGNITKYAEFNAFCDPEAFDIVVKSGIKIIFNPIEQGMMSKVEKNLFDIKTDNPKKLMIKNMVLGIKDTVGSNYICMYDVNSCMALIKPEFFNFVPCQVFIDTSFKVGQCKMKKKKESNLYYQQYKNVKQLNDFILNDLFNL